MQTCAVVAIDSGAMIMLLGAGTAFIIGLLMVVLFLVALARR